MLQTAIKAAREAGKLMINSFGKELKIDSEIRYDTKLALDKECEKVIIDIIKSNFPEHSILAEESGQTKNKSDYTWIIDPLDGTANFAKGIPQFCTSIALVKGSEHILGVVFDPLKDELFHAEKGKGAYLNNKRIYTSNVKRLEDSFMICGFMKSEEAIKKGLGFFKDLVLKVKKVRIMGAAALDLCWVAAGRFELYFEYGIMSWDIAAGTVILQEAGGKITAREITKNTFNVVATNGKILPEETPGT